MLSKILRKKSIFLGINIIIITITRMFVLCVVAVHCCCIIYCVRAGVVLCCRRSLFEESDYIFWWLVRYVLIFEMTIVSLNLRPRNQQLLLI